ncbi:MAG: alpha/beta fold hydrolase [Planctomycetota bacterium]
MKEHVMVFGKAQPLVGIITDPLPSMTSTVLPAILLLNAGLVHRVGPDRLYVELARRLAARGFLVVRFDFSGIGDSPVRADNLPVEESMVLEIGDVMDAVTRRHGIDRFCLMGLCSGAIASFITARQDSRVVGAVLMNARGFARSAAWQHYVESHTLMRHYWTRLLRPGAWWRALTGKTKYALLAKVLRLRFKNVLGRGPEVAVVADSLAADMEKMLARRVRFLLVFADKDPSVDYLRKITPERYRKGRPDDAVSSVTIKGANHIFRGLSHREQVLSAIETWAVRSWPATEHRTPLPERSLAR